MSLQIQRECPEEMPHMRAYFSRTELVQVTVCAERGDPAATAQDPLLEAFLAIPGVVLVGIKPYVVTIAKAPTFEWSEIEGSVLRLMTSLNLGEGQLYDDPADKACPVCGKLPCIDPQSCAAIANYNPRRRT